MIVRPPLHWLRMLLAWRGSVLPGLVPRLALILAFSLLALWVHRSHGLPLNPQPFALIGISLAVFMGFRNNAAYDRYWEGRKLWGLLLIEARTLTRQALTLPRPACSEAEVQALCALLAAFAHTLRHQLRGTEPHHALQRLLPAPLAQRLHDAPQRPALLLLELGRWVAARSSAGALDDYRVLAFDASLARLSEVLGGCERIATTPMPFAYSVMIHRTVYLFCALLPFGLVGSIGVFTPLFTVFVAYTFMAIEALAAELEEPFGMESNDLPLDALCIAVENAMHAMLGDGVQLEAVQRRDYVVL